MATIKRNSGGIHITTFLALMLAARSLEAQLPQLPSAQLPSAVNIEIAGSGSGVWGWAAKASAEFETVSLLFQIMPRAASSPRTITLHRFKYSIEIDPKPQSVSPSSRFPRTTSATDLAARQFPTLHTLATPDCPNPFFGDEIDVFGKRAPIAMRVEPGVLMPQGKKLRVCVVALYEIRTQGASSAMQFASTAAELDVQAAEGGGRYRAYKQAYVRAHMLAVGRGLTNVAMKQFSAATDPKDLLYHSITIRGLDSSGRLDGGRVFIPWTKMPYDTAEPPRLPDGIVFGGDENPLLRGGLAMAVFAQEYETTGNRDSLRHAVRLLRWFEASEFRYQGRGTGFLLRVRRPGEGRPSGHYFFSSADEVAGMMLGLLYLHDALGAHASSNANERTSDQAERTRLRNFVRRFAEHLSANGYLIVPPSSFPRQERQIGWSGTYIYEWYLRQAFRHIVGRDFPPTMTPARLVQILRLPWGRSGDGVDSDNDGIIDDSKGDDLPGVTALIQAGIPVEKRAVLAIQGLGIETYLATMNGCSSSDPAIVLRVGPAGLPGWPVTLTAGDLQSLGVTVKRDYFNATMLLHFFQLAAKVPQRDPAWATVSAQMDAFIAGLVARQRTTLALDLTELGLLGHEFVAINALASALVVGPVLCTIVGPLLDVVLSVNPLLPVPPGTGLAMCAASGFTIKPDFQAKSGSCTQDDNYYAAAIRRRFLATGQNQDVIDRAVAAWHEFWPVSSLDEPEDLNRWNPQKKLGSGFKWEKDPTGRLMESGLEKGLTASMVASLKNNRLESLNHSAGLDFLLPTALLLPRTTGNAQLDRDALVAAGRGTDLPAYLPACTSRPFQAEEADRVRDRLIPRQCQLPWQWPPSNEADEQPAALTCGQQQSFRLNYSTLYGSGSSRRTLPHPVKVYSGAAIILGQSANARDAVNAMRASRSRTYDPVWTGDDIDYHSADCDPQRGLRVRVNLANTGGYYRVVVNDQENIPANGVLDITVPPAPQHVIRITGDRTPYTLQVDPN